MRITPAARCLLSGFGNRGMTPAMRRLLAVGVLAFTALAIAPAARGAGPATVNDTARFLAGMRPSPGSPLAVLARETGWKRHARAMTAAWAGLEQRQFARIRVWAAANLPPRGGPVFYMFGGPDFVHAHAFFPHASSYVLSGLEPVGALPDAMKVSGQALAAGLESLHRSLGNFLQYGYFITREMGEQLRKGAFTGTLPLLYVFLARSGKTIHQVAFVSLSASGSVAPKRGKGAARAVRIVFSGRDGRMRNLYFFRTNLADAGVAKSGFLKFCAKLGTGASLVKSASYLMHVGGFSRVREFLLRHSAVIVQDDSGIPLRYFKLQKWRLRPFGQYIGPIEQFASRYQPGMAELFSKGRARPVNFGIGYRWHPQRTTILVAERLAAPAQGGR